MSRTNRKRIATAGIVTLIGLVGIAATFWQRSQSIRINSLLRQNEQLEERIDNSVTLIEELEIQSKFTNAQLKRVEYSTKLLKADEQFKQGNLEEALEILDSTDPALRGWEYRYLQRKFDPSLSAWKVGDVTSALLSPAGNKVALFGEINDTKTGELIFEFDETQKTPASVAFSSDGRFIAGTGYFDRIGQAQNDAVLSVWDASTGKLVRKISPKESNVLNIALSADGNRVAAAFDSTTQVFDVSTGEKVAEFDNSFKSRLLVFSPTNPDWVAVVESKSMIYRDLITKANLWSSAKVPNAISFTPNGKRILVVEDDSNIRFLEAQSGEELWKRDVEKTVASVAISPSSSLIAMGLGNGEIYVLDSATGGNWKRVGLHGGSVYQVAFLNEQQLVSAGIESEKPFGVSGYWKGDIKVWPLQDESHSQIEAPGSVSSLAVDNNGINLVAGIARSLNSTADNGGSVYVWQMGDNRKRSEFGQSGVVDAGHLDEKTVVLIDQSSHLRLYTIEESKEICSVDLSQSPLDICIQRSNTIVSLMPDRLTRWKVSPENKDMVPGGESELFERHDKFRVLTASDGRLFVGGDTLACFNADNFVQIYEKNILSDWRCVITGLAISQDGKTIATGDSAGYVATWSAENGKLLTREKGSFRGPSRRRWGVSAIAFLPLEQRFVTGHRDGRVTVWDAKTGKSCMGLEWHDNGVTSIAYNEKSDSLITGQAAVSDIGRIKIWNTKALDIQNK